MAKRRKFSRWRRLPEVYRSGELKLPDASTEPQRLTLYLVGRLLDAAEEQAAKAGVDTLQEYCAELLGRAIEAERVREQVADVEAKRGPLEGLHEIANDPEYLAEWSAQADGSSRPAAVAPPAEAEAEAEPTAVGRSVPIEIDSGDTAPPPELAEAPREVAPVPVKVAEVAELPAALSRAARVVLEHAGHAGDDPHAFLLCLRRGESLASADVGSLARALRDLEDEYRADRALDRRVAFALHRLAYEGQILHTDAWPGTFDQWTVDTLRAVQEAVDRILSGRDIRYFSNDTRPEDLR